MFVTAWGDNIFLNYETMSMNYPFNQIICWIMKSLIILHAFLES